MALRMLKLETDEDFIRFCAGLRETGILNIPDEAGVLVDDISGNINRVRRLLFIDDFTGSKQGVVIKTVPENGCLERYPNIRFPEDRLSFEYQYFRLAEEAAETHEELAHWVPGLWHAAKDSPDGLIRALVLEDLTPALTLQAHVLRRVAVPETFLTDLGCKLALFHSWSAQNLEPHTPSNPSAAMNRPFVLTHPFEQAETLGNQWAMQDECWRNRLQDSFMRQFREALLPQARLLLSGFRDEGFNVLTHGDLHAESIFIISDNPVVIDAELCDVGAAWFDTGMVLAHFRMLSVAGNQRLSAESFLKAYCDTLDKEIGIIPENLIKNTFQLAGFEIIRRILGVANMPYLDQQSAKDLLEVAAHYVLESSEVLS